jgi:4-hydroxybenzoate polyprenyltransferase/phosphoserine phosphatase
MFSKRCQPSGAGPGNRCGVRTFPSRRLVQEIEVDTSQTALTIQTLPLCVDLDGTLIATDLLWESLLRGFRQRPATVFKSIAWASRGRAVLKTKLAEQVEFNPALLPYRTEVVDFLRQQKAQGRTLVLATASHRRMAQSVADHLGLFDQVIATDDHLNCKGAAKLQLIRDQFTGGFDYIGDSAADLPLWKEARNAYLVEPSPSVRRRAEQICRPARVFDGPGGKWMALLKLLRPHQWVKNVLIALPLLLAHQRDPHKWFSLIFVFAAFCLCASSVYVLNDLLDLDVDRHHPSKRNRAFAAGILPLAYGPPLVVLLLGITAVICAFLPFLFAETLAIYFCLTMAYSLYWKSYLLVDVMVLGGLYTMRILAGGAAVSVLVSPWLLAFSMFLFVSLAFVKRYTELSQLELNAGEMMRGRGYVTDDLRIIESVGPCSGYMAVLVLALYINSDVATKFYPTPICLWMLCPLMLYWITRIWFFARRRSLPHDPILFAVSDPVTWYVMFLAGIFMVLASRSWHF